MSRRWTRGLGFGAGFAVLSGVVGAQCALTVPFGVAMIVLLAASEIVWLVDHALAGGPRRLPERLGVWIDAANPGVQAGVWIGSLFWCPEHTGIRGLVQTFCLVAVVAGLIGVLVITGIRRASRGPSA